MLQHTKAKKAAPHGHNKKAHKAPHKKQHRKMATKTPATTPHKPLQEMTVKERDAVEKEQKSLVLKGPFYSPANDTFPIALGADDAIAYLADGRQYRNTYKDWFNVPVLYTNDKQRAAVEKEVAASGNMMLTTLRRKLKEYKDQGKTLYLLNLPATSDVSEARNKIYADDPDEYNLPPNKFNNNPAVPAKNFGIICDQKEDILEILQQRRPELLDGSFKARRHGESTGFGQGQRVMHSVLNRVRDPKLYEAFGLDPELHHNRLQMLALHTWFYMHATDQRPIQSQEYFREFIMAQMDGAVPTSLHFDWKIKNAKRKHEMTSLFLPLFRMNMINLDKAMVSLAGGDPEPLYSILYRMFYRPGEAFRYESDMTKRTDIDFSSLQGWDYSPDMEVYMADPVDLAYVNNLANYIVNCLYDMHSKVPRDYSLMINGLIELPLYPNPPTPAQHIGKLKKEEMERWCLTVWQASKSPFMPNFFQRLKNYISPEKLDATNWFLDPKQDGPCWRPPQYSLTATGRKP